MHLSYEAVEIIRYVITYLYRVLYYFLSDVLESGLIVNSTVDLNFPLSVVNLVVVPLGTIGTKALLSR